MITLTIPRLLVEIAQAPLRCPGAYDTEMALEAVEAAVQRFIDGLDDGPYDALRAAAHALMPTRNAADAAVRLLTEAAVDGEPPDVNHEAFDDFRIEVEPDPGPAVDLGALFAAADAHGAATGEPDHALGDLQGMVRAAWNVMDQAGRRAWLASPELDALSGIPEYAGLLVPAQLANRPFGDNEEE